MPPFLPQARPEMPTNAMLNFAPLNNAIDGNRRNAMMAQQADIQRQELGMRQQQMDMQQKRFDRDDEMATVKRLGMRAQAIDALPPNDPRRAQAWGAIMKEHPGAGGLDQSWHDPVQGPKMLIAEAGQWQDPLQRQLLQAQIAKANREASGTGPETYGKTGAIFQGPDGHFYSIQFGERGTQKVVRVEAPGQGPGPGVAGPPTAPMPLTPARGVGTVEAGPETIVYNKADGNRVGSFSRNLGAAEVERAQGQSTGKALADLPKVEELSTRIGSQVDAVLNDPNLPNVTGWQANLPTFNPRNVDTEERIAQLGGAAFLQAFESLKGGGQITEIEGKKATDAMARLTNLRQSDEGFKTALQDFKKEVGALVELARRKARSGQQQPGAAGAGNAPDPLGIR